MAKTIHQTEQPEDTAWVMSALEHGQLVEAAKRPLPRRNFGRGELIVIWALRAYVVFMLAAVVFQIIHGSGQ